MNKQEFLAAVRAKLAGLPPSDVERSLDYYSEMIDDRMEDGLREEEAVAAMGSADDIAAQIIMETPLPTLVKAKMKPDRSIKVWEVLLLILGSPLWLTLLLGAAIVVFSLYIVLWAVVVVLYAADLSLAAGALCGVIGLFPLLFRGFPGLAVLFLGAGLICAGLTVLLFFLCNQAARAALFLCKLPIRAVKSRFIHKGEGK